MDFVKKTAYSVETNTDLTEGRGQQYYLYVCEMEATARRLAKGKGVMGPNASVHAVDCYKINRITYVPGLITTPSLEDIAAQKLIDQEKADADALNSLIEWAKENGASESHIKHLYKLQKAK